MTRNPARGQLIASPRWSLPNPVPGRAGAGWRGDPDGDDIEQFLAEDGSRAKVTAKPGTPRLDHADREKAHVGSDRIA